MTSTAALLALLLSAAPATAAVAPFTVVAPNGDQVAGTTILAGERKVVVLVTPASEAAVRLVNALARWSSGEPRWRSRVVIIVRAPLPQAHEWLMAQWGGEDLPPWGANADASAWQSLGFQGLVGVAGVENGAIDWKLDGVIDDPSAVELPMRAWTGIEAR
jgi:hypothetical protein